MQSRWRKCLSDIWHVNSFSLMSDFRALPIFVERTVRLWQRWIGIIISRLSVLRHYVCHVMACCALIYAISILGGRYILCRSVLLNGRSWWPPGGEEVPGLFYCIHLCSSMDRALEYESRGWRFESFQRCHKAIVKKQALLMVAGTEKTRHFLRPHNGI